MDGAGVGPSYSPSARSLPPSDPSDFSSWHGEDTTSSRGSHGMFIVNLMRDGSGVVGPPIGDHLKNKLKNMIQQKFDGFLVIKNTDQNEKGKLVTVVCDLTISSENLVRIDIACNENNTFFIIPSLETEKQDIAPEVAGEIQRWVEQVSNFGMSGTCMSLSAFLHYGFSVWKQSQLRPRAKGPQRSPAVNSVAEEPIGDERTSFPAPTFKSTSSPPFAAQPLTPASATQGSVPMSGPPTLGTLNYVDLEGVERHDSSHSGISGLVRRDKMPLSLSSMLAQAQELALAGNYLACVEVTSDALQSEGALGDMATTNQLLLLRASAHHHQRQHAQSLRDSEQVIQSDPTCVAGYSLQADALQGLGKVDDALEAIMCAMEYDPHNPDIQEAFSVLFNDASRARARRERPNRVPPRSLSRVRLPDALSTTTQATRLSSKSTTPTDQSPGSRSSSDSDCVVDNDGFSREREPRKKNSESFATADCKTNSDVDHQEDRGGAN